MTFRILHVCTGNICRSPMAEHLMWDGFRARGLGDVFEVRSAGTWGHAGEPMEPFALSTLRGYGIDGAPFRASALVAGLVAGADLVLGATREHRAAAVVLQPRAARKTFTLREFDRLPSGIDVTKLPTGDPVERAHAVVLAAAGQRGIIRPDRLEDDDVTDPYQGPEVGFQTCAQLLASVLERPVAVLSGL